MNILSKIFPAFLIAMFCVATIPEAMAESKESLSPREKAFISIAAFTATGDMPKLKGALNKGLDAGLTANEVKEILIHTYAYAGFPRALNGINACMAVMNERSTRGITDKIGKEATPMPLDLDKGAYGHKVRNSLVGRDISKRTSGYPIFTPAIDLFLVEHLFADIFYRDIFSHKERELITVSILAAMTGTQAQLKTHLRISMSLGWRNTQLEDFVSVLRQEVGDASAERAFTALSELAGIHPAEKQPKALKVIRKGAATKVSADRFTGNVTVGSWFSSEIPDSYRGGIVNFEAGARTAWHTHPLGQTLIVISGRGLVQSEGEAVQEILPGDVVWIPADERHWHGAAPDSPMSHTAISDPLNGVTAGWMEHVTDEQYAE